jgi:hypothetical protein
LKKKLISFIGLPLFMCSFLLCASDARTRIIVSKFKQSEVGRAFLINHSEKDLEIVLSFQWDPLRNFQKVQRVANVCSYIWAYAGYLAETKQKDDAGYLDFFSKHFRIATDDNVPILTYLLLNCNNAFLGEELSDVYTTLFGSSPKIFIKDLRRRKNWKQIVDETRAGNWRAFKEGLAKLGDSGFELELKNYVLSMSK